MAGATLKGGNELICLPKGARLWRPNVREDDLILLPPQGGDPGEAAVMGRLVNDYAPDIEEELDNQMAWVLAAGTAAAMLARADGLPWEGLARAINPFLKESARAAILVQATLLEAYGIGVPVSLAESFVAQWVNGYGFNLVSGINRNSRHHLQKHISQWARKNEDLPMLIKRLTPWFGRTRAELIATTEATRAFTEGTFTAWERSGFNKRPPMSQRPPAHPRCRCFVSLMPGTPWEYVWYTVNDQLVCPICEPRHLTAIGVAGTI